MTDAPHHYDPLVDKPPRKKKNGAGVAIIISVVLHAGLFTYLWFNKFVVHYKAYSDEAVKVNIVKPVAPPPPPPPPPPPNTPPPPPPPVQPRPAVVVPDAPPAPPPIQIAPVEHHEPPPPPAPPHVARITNPDWLHKPNGDDFVSYYPARAMELDKEGKVTLSCTVTASGTLTDCSVDETPAGYGFGDATLKIAKLFKMKPQSADGQPVEGGKFTTVVVWRLAE